MFLKNAFGFVAIALLVSACSWGSLDGLHRDPALDPFSSSPGPQNLSTEFHRRVEATFPPGTPVDVMAVRLESAGFTVHRDIRLATLKWGIVPACFSEMKVWWAGDEVVEAVDASYLQTCL